MTAWMEGWQWSLLAKFLPVCFSTPAHICRLSDMQNTPICVPW